MSLRGRPPVTRAEIIAVTALGDTIRAARLTWQERTGGTVLDLLRTLGIPSGTYYRYERGQCAPSITALATLSGVLPLQVTIRDTRIIAEVVGD